MSNRSEADMTSRETIFHRASRREPDALRGWGDEVCDWYDAYQAMTAGDDLCEICLDTSVFAWDHRAERVVFAYAVSTPQLMARDAARIRGFPNVNVSVQAVLGAKAFKADKGHFLGHASGGVLDINLFPHRRELNRGWSDDGKRFRRMERYVAAHIHLLLPSTHLR